MSFEAFLWAANDAPVADVNEFAVLISLAERADPDGSNAFPSIATVAERTRIHPRTVKRCLQYLEDRRLIARGDQRAAEYIRADRRPTVYDLLIPYRWFSNIDRINADRARRNMPPLTPEMRPDLDAAPEKKRRADAGQKRPKGERGDFESPRDVDCDGVTTSHGVTSSPERGDLQSATGCLVVTRTSPENQSKEEPARAPSARSAGGVRSTSSSGSSAREGSGSAATEQPASPSNTPKAPKLTASQRKAVLAVESVLPPVLLAALPYGHIPNRNRPAVLAALESRTVGQLADRVRRRWAAYGYEAAFHSGEIGSLVGAALELLAPTPHCPDLSCEDGWMVDTGEQCRACVQRRADRRAARARGQTPAGGTVADRPECVDCGRPFPGAVPGDGLCRSCAVTPTAAMEALLAQWAAEDAAAQQTEALFAEADRRRKQRAADRPTTPQHGTSPF